MLSTAVVTGGHAGGGAVVSLWCDGLLKFCWSPSSACSAGRIEGDFVATATTLVAAPSAALHRLRRWGGGAADINQQ